MSGKLIPVIEYFGPTIQGEGSMCGFQTMFLRLGLCDFKCPMCDSMHAVDPKLVKANATYMPAIEAAKLVIEKAGKCPWVTISGGNPCLWDLNEAIDEFHRVGMKVAIETQGTRWQDWLLKCDVVTISPKGPGMGESFLEQDFEVFRDRIIKPYHDFFTGDSSVRAEYKLPQPCLKIVCFGDDDLQFAKDVYALTDCPELPLYLSLGNPILPGNDMSFADHVSRLSADYQSLAERMYQDPVLSKAIFLPQLHVFIWSNKQGV